MYDAKDYTEAHRKFLEENNPSVLRGQKGPNSYLSSVGEQAESMFEHLMTQRMHQPEVKNLPHLEKVREFEAFRHEADEIVRHDLIYQPLPEELDYDSQEAQDDRDTEKMLASIASIKRRRMEMKETGVTLYDRENYPTAMALVMARAARRVAVKYGDFGLAKAAKRLHERAEKALSMRRSTLPKED